MSVSSIVQTTLLSRLNERQVFQALQNRGPMSRAEVARYSGISAPTASKAIEALLRAGLLEEGEAPLFSRGRPARKLSLATRGAQVLGVVIDARACRVASAGLDGVIDDKQTTEFETPATYAELLERAASAASELVARTGVETLGLGVSVPGLVDYKAQRGLLSPNVPITNDRCPSRDLSEKLGIDCVLVQESHALCLAERQFGLAKGLSDFAMLDVGSGIGLGVMAGGHLHTGHSGLAGEIGHITVNPDGRPCGCGNIGCLETVASDAALAWTLSRRLSRPVTVDEAVSMARTGQPEAQDELERMCRYLGIGVATVINLFNPSTLFLHGRLFSADSTLLERVVKQAGKRALKPSFEDCKIAVARGSKRQGAVAAIIDHLTNVMAPGLIGSGPLVSTRVAMRAR